MTRAPLNRDLAPGTISDEENARRAQEADRAWRAAGGKHVSLDAAAFALGKKRDETMQQFLTRARIIIDALSRSPDFMGACARAVRPVVAGEPPRVLNMAPPPSHPPARSRWGAFAFRELAAMARTDAARYRALRDERDARGDLCQCVLVGADASDAEIKSRAESTLKRDLSDETRVQVRRAYDRWLEALGAVRILAPKDPPPTAA